MYWTYAIMAAVGFATALVVTPLTKDFAKRNPLGFIVGFVIGGVFIFAAYVLQNEFVSRTELMVIGFVVYVVTLFISSRLWLKRGKSPSEK